MELRISSRQFEIRDYVSFARLIVEFRQSGETLPSGIARLQLLRLLMPTTFLCRNASSNNSIFSSDILRLAWCIPCRTISSTTNRV